MENALSGVEKPSREELYQQNNSNRGSSASRIDAVINSVVERNDWLEYQNQNFLIAADGDYVELNDYDLVHSSKLLTGEKMAHQNVYSDATIVHFSENRGAVESSGSSSDIYSTERIKATELGALQNDEDYNEAYEYSVYNSNGRASYTSRDSMLEGELLYEGHSTDASSSTNYRMSKRGPTTKICEYCGLFLRHPSKIAAHMRTHTGERPFTCEYCGQDFSQRTPYRMHVKRHIGDLPFSCSFCAKKFPSNASRNGHEIRVHHKLKRQGQPQPHLKPAQNNIEKRDVDYGKSTTVNWQPPIGEIRRPISDIAMRRISNIVEFVAAGIHKNIVNSSPKVQPSESFSQSNRRYEDRHPPTVAQCADCGLIFKHPSKIQAHMRTHTGEKPFQCLECGLGCSTNSALRVHIRRFHTGERPHECTWECGKRFVSVAARNEHERIVHAGIKRYQCTIGDCRRLFTRRSYMVKHLQTHSAAEEFDAKRPITAAFKRLQTESRSNAAQHQKADGNGAFLEYSLCESQSNDGYAMASEQYDRKAILLSSSHGAASGNDHSMPQQRDNESSNFSNYPYRQNSMEFQMSNYGENDDSASYFECDESELQSHYPVGDYDFSADAEQLKENPLHSPLRPTERNNIQYESIPMLPHNFNIVFKGMISDGAKGKMRYLKKIDAESYFVVESSFKPVKGTEIVSADNESWNDSATVNGDATDNACDVSIHGDSQGYAGMKPKRKYSMKKRRSATVFQCKICNLTIKYPSKIMEHMRVHTGERPFKCVQCSATFTQSGALTAHVRSHYGHRPFECSFCSRRFTTSGQRTAHEKMCNAFTRAVEFEIREDLPTCSKSEEAVITRNIGKDNQFYPLYYKPMEYVGVDSSVEEVFQDDYIEEEPEKFDCSSPTVTDRTISSYCKFVDVQAAEVDVDNMVEEKLCCDDGGEYSNHVDESLRSSEFITEANIAPVKADLFNSQVNSGSPMIVNLNECNLNQRNVLCKNSSFLIPAEIFNGRKKRCLMVGKETEDESKIKVHLREATNLNYVEAALEETQYERIIVEEEHNGNRFHYILQRDDERDDELFNEDEELNEFAGNEVKYVEANVQPPSKGRKRNNANEEKVYVGSDLFKYALPQVVSRRSKFAVVPVDLQFQCGQKQNKILWDQCYPSTSSDGDIYVPTPAVEASTIVLSSNEQLSKQAELNSRTKRHLDRVIDSIAKGGQSKNRDSSTNKSSYPRRPATFHKCEYCGRVLKYPSKIEAHMRTHTQERPFKCTICGLGFAQNTTLRMHLRRHLNHKPFECPYSGCEYKFINGGLLNAHIQKRHLQQRQQKERCNPSQ